MANFIEILQDIINVKYPDIVVKHAEVMDAVAIDHVSRTSGDGSPGSTDVYTLWKDAAETVEVGSFSVYNGRDGQVSSGGGDMFKSVYDPDGIEADAFDADNMKDGLSKVIMTALERDKLQSIQPGAEVNAVDSVAGKTGAVVLDKNDVGLGNVDNTSDADKPISNAVAAALGGKADVGHQHTADDILDFQPGATTFDELTDTPATKIAGKYVKVSADGQTLEYADGSGPVNIDGIATVNDIFALQGYTGYQDNDVIYMSGYWPNGEDNGMGAGFFKYDANQSHTFLGANILDNGIFVKPTDNSGTTGCWVRICNHKETNPFWFGAVGRDFGYYDSVSAPYRPASNHFATLAELNAFYFDQTLTLDDEIDTCAWIQALWSNEIRHRSYNSAFDYWNLETSININLPEKSHFFISKPLKFRAARHLNMKFNGSKFVATQNFPAGTLEDPSPIIWVGGETRKKEPLALIDQPTITYHEAKTAWGLIDGLYTYSEYRDPNVTTNIGKHGGTVGLELTSGANRTIRNCNFASSRISLLMTGTHMLVYIYDNYFQAEMDCLYMSQYYGDFTTSVYVRRNEFQNFGRYAIYGYLGGTGIDCVFENNDIEAQINYSDGYTANPEWFVCGIKSAMCITNGNNINIKGFRHESITGSLAQLHLNGGNYYIEGNGGLNTIYAAGNRGSTQAYQDFMAANHFCIIDPSRNYLPKTATDHPSTSKVTFTLKSLRYFTDIYTDKQNWTDPIAQTISNVMIIDMPNMPKLHQLINPPTDGSTTLPDPKDSPDLYEIYPEDSPYWSVRGGYYTIINNDRLECGNTKIGGDITGTPAIEGIKWEQGKFSYTNGESGLIKWDDGHGSTLTDYNNKSLWRWLERQADGSFKWLKSTFRFTTLKTEYLPVTTLTNKDVDEDQYVQGDIIYNTAFDYDNYPVIGKVNILNCVYTGSYPAWAANIAVNQDDIYKATGGTVVYVFKALNAGTTGATEPSWNKGVKLTTIDNDITWECIGSYYGDWAYIQPLLSGKTTQRPSNPPVGFRYFDTDLGKPIFWSGTQWVDANGTAV